MTRDTAPPTPPPDRRRQIAAAVVAALIALGALVSAIVGGGDSSPPARTTVTLGGPATKVPGQPSQHKITLDEKGQQIVEAQKAEDAAGDDAAAESDLHESKLPTDQAEQLAEKLTPPGQPPVPEHVPLAAASQPGCTTSFVRNYSERHGAPVLLGFIHWTGSPITVGPQGGLAIVHWFDLSAAQASSNYITDQAGRCWYTVPETKKAWTQAGANPWAVSVEIINPGVLPLFRSAAGRKIVVKLIQGWHKRWHIPYRHGKVNTATCVPIRSGFLAHRDGGPCAGGHPDVGIPSAVDGLIAEAARTDPSNRHVTSVDRVTCRKLTWWRAHGRPHGKPEANAVRRRKALDGRHVTCTPSGPRVA